MTSLALLNKVALVTGATSGVGQAIAGVLSARGCRVICCGLDDPEKGVKSIKDMQGPHTPLYYQSDVSDAASIFQLFKQCESKLGGIDILVNNAGIQNVAKVEDTTAERWDAVIAVNLTAAFHTTRLAVPHMKKVRWGRILNIASAHGLARAACCSGNLGGGPSSIFDVGSPEKAPYVAAKHGLVGLTKAVALETAGTGVTCNAICPGWVRTPLVEAQIEANAQRAGISVEAATKELLRDKHPSEEFVAPDDIAEFCAFLCSPAASQMTGAALSMDGGWVAR